MCDIAGPAVSRKVVGFLELQDGILRHWTVLAIHIERRVGAEGIQRSLKLICRGRIDHASDARAADVDHASHENPPE